MFSEPATHTLPMKEFLKTTSPWPTSVSLLQSSFKALHITMINMFE